MTNEERDHEELEPWSRIRLVLESTGLGIAAFFVMVGGDTIGDHIGGSLIGLLFGLGGGYIIWRNLKSEWKRW